MGKTLADVDLQVRQLIGDYQRTQFTEDQVREAINWGQNAVMRLKGFKVASRLYSTDGYPTGDMPTDLLAVKRVQLVGSALVAGAGVDSSDVNDTVLRALDESSMAFEDGNNELWRFLRPKFPPKRWVMTGDQQFCVVPPGLPTTLPSEWDAVDPATIFVRLHYIKMATPVVLLSDPIDPSIPDYYQEAIRYIAVAYLMETDTDLKSVQIKKEMTESFGYHMAAGLDKLATGEVDQ